MNVWSLFSGVGGFDLGLERAGMRVTLQCEADAWRRRVLAHHFPGVAQHDDVSTLRVEAGAVPPRLLCGGFPCQDLSVAGRRAGLDGGRSGLFFEYARIADELELAERGGWVFLENVPGLFSSNGGRDFGVVLQTLADLGFAVSYRILDSRHHGVPQRRRRVFIVGHPRAEYARAVLLESEGSVGDSPSRRSAGEEPAVASLSGLGSGGPDDNDAQSGRLVAGVLGEHSHTLTSEGFDASEDGTGRGTPVVAYQCHGNNVGPMGTLRRGDGGLTSGVPFVAFHATQDPITSTDHTPALSKGSSGGTASLGVAGTFGVRRLTPVECERLQGFPDNWTAIDGEPEYVQSRNGSWRAKSGTPDNRRYAAMGDAVTVNVIEQIGRRIMAVEAAA